MRSRMLAGWGAVIASLSLVAVSGRPGTVAAAGDPALPPWAAMPTKQQPAREIQLATPDSTALGTIAGSMPVHLGSGGRLLQIGALRWTGDQLGALAVRQETDRGWFEATAPAEKLRLPLPAGTAGAAEPGGLVVAMTLVAARVQPLAHRGGQTLVEVVGEPTAEALNLWVADDRLEITATARPVPAAWRRPGQPLSRRGPPDACELELFAAPDLDVATARPFRKLTVCRGDGRELRVAERRGAWTRLWVRERPRPTVAFTGWIRTPKPLGATPCLCGGIGLAAAATPYAGKSVGSYSVYFALRDLPLYAKADREARPVGVLLKGRYEFRREAMPERGQKAPDFVPVTLQGARLWVPYRPDLFEYRSVAR